MIYEGHALSLTLSLRTSFAWAGGKSRRQRLVFDIVPNPEDWIVLGRKKGFWDAEVSRIPIELACTQTDRLSPIPRPNKRSR